jgi:CRISPR system Cascade subunit CasB
MSLYFKKEHREGELLIQWWSSLEQDTGGRARLRRCRSPEEVLLEPAFHRLLNRLRPLLEQQGRSESEIARDMLRLAAVAGLLSHVRKPDNRSLADSMAEKRGQRALVSPLRFRRLLKVPFEELYEAMIRVLRQLDRQASLFDLANSVFYWGDKIRKRWALTYFPKVTD